MAITRYAGDRFVIGSSPDVEPTGVLDGAFLINTGNLSQKVLRNGTWTTLAGGGGGGSTDPAGSNTQVQFNNNGVFGATTGLTFDGQRLYANNFQLSGILYDSNASVGEGGMVLANEGTTGVNWKNIESVLSGVGGSGVANYVAKWSDEDTLTSGTIYDNGTEVGIGTTTPQAQTDIVEVYADSVSAVGKLQLLIRGSQTDLDPVGDSCGIGFGYPSVNNYVKAGIINEFTSANGTSSLHLCTTATAGAATITKADARLTILSNGKVGIGTDAPSFALDVRKPTNNNDDTIINIQSSWANTSTNKKIGSVQFSASDAQVNSGNDYVTARIRTESSNEWTSAANVNSHILFQTISAASLDERMRITHDGKVGIGTTAPAEILEIVSDSDPTILIRPVTVDSANSGKISYRENAGGTTGVDLRYDGANNKFIIDTSDVANALVIKRTDGKVGIGITTPDSLLQIANANGSSYRFGYAGTSDVYFDADDVYFRSDNGGVNNMVLKGSKLGIGTAAPWARFTVAGGTTSEADDFIPMSVSPSVAGGNSAGILFGVYPVEGYAKQGIFWERYASTAGYGGRGKLHFVNRDATDTSVPTIADAKMTILEDGKVGIGTDAPAKLVDIHHATEPILRLTNTRNWTSSDSGNMGSLEFYTTDASGAGARVISSIVCASNAGSTAPNGELVFSTAVGGGSGTAVIERMRILDDGKVGIGTATPSSLLELYSSAPELTIKDGGTWGTNATAYINLKDSSSSMAYIGVTETGGDLDIKQIKAGAVRIFTNNTEKVRVLSDGKVGIGTTAPSRLLTLENNTGTVANQSQLRINNAGAGDSYIYMYAGTDWAFGIDNSDGDKFKFNISNDVSDGTEVLTLQRDGNVGIGITSPSTKLHVEGVTSTRKVAIFESDYNDTNPTDVVIKYKKNVYGGIDDTEMTRLSFEGVDNSANSETMGRISTYLTDQTVGSTSAALAFSTIRGNILTEAIRIQGDGNVGVNTLLPEHKLHVAGDAIISGVLYDSINSSGAAGHVFTSEVGGPQWKMIEDVLSGVGGDGTADYVPRWIDSDTIGDSVIAQSGSAIGIGTAAPASKLQVSTTDAVSVLTIHRDGSNVTTANTSLGRIQFAQDYDAGQQNWGHIDFVTTATSAYRTNIDFHVKSTSGNVMRAMTINGTDSAGPRVGIEINAPNANLHVGSAAALGSQSNPALQIGGTTYYRLGFYTTAEGAVIENKNGDDGIIFKVKTLGEAMRIDSPNGSVGIGTTTPAEALEVYNASEPRIRVTAGTNSNPGYEWAEGATRKWVVYNENSGDNLQFKTNSDVRMVVQQDGNVGIGNNLVDPQRRLHVSGDAIISGVLYDSTNSSGDLGEVLTSEVGGPQWKMIEDVLSGVGGNGTANYVPKWIDSDTIGDSLIYDDATNVGIGTTNPQRLLHVNGDAIVSGKFYDQTNSTGDKGYVLTSDDNGPLWKASGDFDGLSGNLITTGQTLTTDINAVASNLVTTGQTLTTNINGLAGNVGTTGQTLTNLIALTGTTNAAAIVTNASAIADNTANLIATGAIVDDVSGNLITTGTTNAAAIVTNASAIAANTSNLILTGAIVDDVSGNLITTGTTNAAGIVTNASAIAANTSNLILTGAIVDDVSGNLITTGQYLTDEINTVSGLIPPTVVDGAGVTGYTARWFDGNTLTTGTLYDDGTNVGIGTTAPAYTLDVQGNIGRNSTGTLVIQGGNSASNDYTQTNLVEISASSINPNQPNHGGNARVASIQLLHHNLAGSASSGSIKFYTQATNNVSPYLEERMVIKPDGKVGIGITNPGYLLDVNGTANIGGALTVADPSTLTSWGDLLLLKRGGSDNYKVSSNKSNIQMGNMHASGWLGFLGGNNIRLYLSSGGQFYPAANGTQDLGLSGNRWNNVYSEAGDFSGTLKTLGYLRAEGGTIYLGTDCTLYRSGATAIRTNSSLTVDGALTGTSATFSGDVKAAQFYTSYDWTSRSGGINIGNQGLTTGAVSFFDGVLASSASIYRDSSSVFFVGARGGTNTAGIAIATDGNVGIGITNPSYKLQVVGDVRVNSGHIFLDDTNKIQWGGTNARIDGSTGGDYLRFFTTNTERVRIDSSGNVTLKSGSDSTNTRHALLFQGGATNLEAKIQSGNYGSYHGGLEFWVSNQSSAGTTLTQVMTIVNEGAIQFNTYGSGTHTGTAEYKLSVDSSGNVIETAIGAGAVDGSGTANYVTKWTDGDTIGNSVIRDDGTNVGIGTTGNGYKLRVQGNVYISGTLTEASSLALKENIETYSPSLEKINKIRPVRYNKKESNKKEVGLVAEELAEMFPELVEMDKDGNPAGVNYSRAVAVLLHGFKELYKEVKEIKEKI